MSHAKVELLYLVRHTSFHQYEQMFERTIQAGQNNDVFRADMEARLLALALFGQCNWTYTWMRPAGRLTPTAIGQHFADIFLQGIAKS